MGPTAQHGIRTMIGVLYSLRNTRGRNVIKPAKYLAGLEHEVFGVLIRNYFMYVTKRPFKRELMYSFVESYLISKYATGLFLALT
jgi:hypothetical protein